MEKKQAMRLSITMIAVLVALLCFALVLTLTVSHDVAFADPSDYSITVDGHDYNPGDTAEFKYGGMAVDLNLSVTPAVAFDITYWIVNNGAVTSEYGSYPYDVAPSAVGNYMARLTESGSANIIGEVFFDIVPKTVSISWIGTYSMPYSPTAYTVDTTDWDLTVNGLIGSEVATASWEWGTYENETWQTISAPTSASDAGEYTLRAVLGGADKDNYVISAEIGDGLYNTYEISPQLIANPVLRINGDTYVDPSNSSVVYTGNAPEATLQLSDIFAADEDYVSVIITEWHDENDNTINTFNVGPLYYPTFKLTGAKAQNYTFGADIYYEDNSEKIEITPADFTATISKDLTQWGEGFSLASKCHSNITLLPGDNSELPVEWRWTNNPAAYDDSTLTGWVTSAPAFPNIAPGTYQYGAAINESGASGYNANYQTKYIYDDFVIEKARVYTVIAQSIYQGTTASPTVSFYLFTEDSNINPIDWPYVANISPVYYSFNESNENRIDAGTYHVNVAIQQAPGLVLNIGGDDYTYPQLFVLIDDNGDIAGDTYVIRSFEVQKKNLSPMLAFDNFGYGDTPTLPTVDNGVTIVGWAYRSGVQETISTIEGYTLSFEYAVEEGGVPEADWAWTSIQPAVTGTYYARVILTCPNDCNYVGGTSTGSQFTIAPRIVSLNWTNDVLEYNGDNQLPTLTLSNVLPEDEANLGFTITGERTNFGGGTATVTSLTGIVAVNYTLPLDTTHSFTITQKIVYYDIVAKHSIYGESLVALEATLNANYTLITGDATPAFTLAVYSYEDFEHPENNIALTSLSNVGAYPIRLTDSDPSDNYDVRAYQAYYYIDGATITDVSISQTGSLTYTGEPQTPTVTAPTATTVNNQSLTGIKYGTSAGSYDDAIPSFTDAGNHTIYFELTATNHASYEGYFTISIIKADSSWTVPTSCSPITFNGTAQALVNAPTNVVGGEVKYSLDGGENWSTEIPTGTNATNYSITVKIFGDSNHWDKSALINLTINKATITITPNSNQKKTYGDADPTLYYISSETYNSDELVFDGALSRVAGENVGTYAITLGTLGLTNAAVNANYELELNATPVLFTINQRNLAFDFENEFEYDGISHKPVVENVEGLQFTDEWGTDIDIVWTDGTTIEAGTYNITHFAFSGTKASNYTHASFYTSMTILSRSLTIEWHLDGNAIVSGHSVPYDGTEHVITAVAGNTIGNDVVELQVTGTTTCTNVIFGLSVSVSAIYYTATGSSNANYRVESGLANRTITWNVSRCPTELALFVNNLQAATQSASVIYNKSQHTFEIKAKDIDDNWFVIYTDGMTSVGNNSKSYTLNEVLTDANYAANANYTFTWSVEKKEIGIDWSNLELSYSMAAQLPTATATNVATGDTVNLTVTGGQIYPGDYTATVTDLDNDNYKLPTDVTHDFTITAKNIGDDDIVVTINGTYTYSGTEQTVSFTVKHGETTLVEGVDYTVDSGFKGTSAANYGLGIVGMGYYTGNGGAAWSIEPFSFYYDNTVYNFYYDSTKAIDNSMSLVYRGVAYTITMKVTVTLSPGVTETFSVPFSTDASVVDQAKNVGDYTVFIDADEGFLYGYDNFKMKENTSNSWTWHITQREVTVGFDGNGYIYNGEAQMPNIILGNTYGADDVEGVYADGSIPRKNVGTNYPAIVDGLTGEDAANYKLPVDEAARSETFRIDKLAVEVEWRMYYNYDNPITSFTTVYDGQLYFCKPFITNACGDDDVYFGMAQTSATNVGNYNASVYLEGADKDNYILYNGDATHAWSITPLPIVLTWSNNSIEYDGGMHNVTAYPSNRIGTDEITFTYDDGDAHYKNANVGNATYTRAVTDLGNANYTIVGGTDISHDWTITPKAITIVYSASQHQSVVFGNIDAWTALGEEMEAHYFYVTGDVAYGDSIEDVVGLDIRDAKGDSVFADLGPTTPVGKYDLVAIDKNNTNYVVTITLGEEAYLQITKNVYDMSAITFANINFVYDGQEHVAIISGTLPDGVTVAYETNSLTNVGTITATAIFTGDENDYEPIENMTATITITKKALTVTADNKQATYGDAVPTYTVSCAGFAGEETAEVLGGELAITCTYAVRSVVGTYDIIPSGLTSGNYKITFVNGTLTVTAKAVSVTAVDKASVYGDALVALTANTSGIVAGDGDADVYTLTKAAGNTAGTYAINVLVANNANYVITKKDATYTITARPITVVADNKISAYGKPLEALTATVTGLVAGDSASSIYTLSTTAVSTANPGAYPIVVTVVPNANYTVTKTDGLYTIKEADPVVAPDGTKTFEKEISVEDAKEGVNVKDLFVKADQEEGNKAVEIKVADATITFDADAVEAISGQDVTFSIDVKKEVPADAPKGAVLVIEVELDGATFPNGTAKVSVAFDGKAPAGKEACVYFVDASGKKTAMKTTYSNGVITFETNHFSTYIVAYKLTTGAIAGIVVACAVVVAGAVIAVLFLLKKKKGNAPKAEETAEEEQEPEESSNDVPIEDTVEPEAPAPEEVLEEEIAEEQTEEVVEETPAEEPVEEVAEEQPTDEVVEEPTEEVVEEQKETGDEE